MLAKAPDLCVRRPPLAKCARGGAPLVVVISAKPQGWATRPSFELNVGNTNIPLQTEPSGGLFGLGLFLPVGIDKFTPIQPTADPAGVADNSGTSQ
jgi:hypothetical protein